jgi:hypothetical protein
MLLEAVVPDLLNVFLRHHPAGAGGQCAVEGHEVGERLVQVEAHPVGIDNGDLAHLLLEQLRALRALEAELHVLSGEGIAVVELHPLAQLELVDALVGAHRPRLGQARGHEVARHGLHERVVDRVLHPEGRDLAQVLAGIEPLRRERHVERPAHLALGLRRGGIRGRRAGQEGAEQQEDGRAQALGHDPLQAQEATTVRPMRGRYPRRSRSSTTPPAD